MPDPTTSTKILTQDFLKSVLRYCPETGVFTWIGKGRLAGGANAEGYWNIEVRGKTYKAHRLAWLYMTGEWPELHIDHKNKIKGDNRWANLRLSTHSQNNMNRERQSNNTSGYRGVSWHCRVQKWVARISINNCSKALGVFSTPEAAYDAYLSARKELFGEFA